MITQPISQEEKVNLIFEYIFDGDKHIQEEEFWNKLSKEDLVELKKVEDEKSISFEVLKKSV